MMDEQSQKTLAEITAKEPAALSESEIAFLRARRSYLTEPERDVFAELLAEESVVEAKTDEVEPEAPKKSKKAKTDEVES